jgi:MFS superfamily sulfate permease-like transporter
VEDCHGDRTGARGNTAPDRALAASLALVGRYQKTWLRAELSKRGITLAVARANAPLREMLQRTGVTDAIGAENFYPSVRTAVQAYLDSRAARVGLTEGAS